MFRTELDRAIFEPGPAARIMCRPGLVGPGGRVISPNVPQPPQLGDDSPVYDDGVLRITRIPGPGVDPAPGSRYALAGEIDEATVGGLASALAQIATDLDEVHLDLGALEYSDLAGLRVIVQLTADGQRPVILHRLPPHLRAILGIVGWDTAPGVEFPG